MDFGFTDEQEELRAQVRRFLDKECSLERVRELMAPDAGFDRELWRRVAELGWLGLTVPEDDGGLGLAWEELVIVLAEMGRSLCPLPVLANAVAERLIVALGEDAQRARWLPGAMDGSVLATLALREESDRGDVAGVELAAEPDGDGVKLTGRKLFVAEGMAADLLLVAAREGDGVSLFAVRGDAEGVTRTPLRGFDATKRTAIVELDGVRVAAADRLGAAGDAGAALEEARHRALIGFAAETAGAAAGALRLAVDYAKVREQFGSPIGRFQGVKHRCAELHVEAESAASLATYASWVVDHEPDAAERYASMAIAMAADAADHAGEECIQVHGAIGYTWECDAHLYYKRGRYARIAEGSPDQHYERVLAVQGL